MDRQMCETPARREPSPVAGPSSAPDAAITSTPGGSVVLDCIVTGSGGIRVARRPRPQRDDGDSAGAGARGTPRRAKLQKRLAFPPRAGNTSSNRPLTDRDIESILEGPDSASEEDEGEVFLQTRRNVGCGDDDDDDILEVVREARSDLESHALPLEQLMDKVLTIKETEKAMYTTLAFEGEEIELENAGEGHLQSPVQSSTLPYYDDEAVMQQDGERDVGAEVRSPVEPAVFEWSDCYDTFTGQQETYEREAGPTNTSTCPWDLFKAIFDVTLIQLIVQETNRYAWQTIAGQSESESGILPNSRLHAWQETNVSEMYAFLALQMWLSICYRARLDEYWTTGTLEMPRFRNLLSRDRFLLLLRFLHFVDNDISTHRLDSYGKKISKIAPIVNYCNAKFQELYVPKRHLSLDESLLLWKGRLSWTQCIRTKAARFGIKSFDLCEGDSGYLLETMLYAGKNSSGTEDNIAGFTNSTAKVVLKLAEDYLDVGHTLVMDNWYNQMPLTRYLKTNRRTDVLGTQNRRRIGVPAAIRNIDERHMSRGDIVAQHCGDISLVAWKDVKLVTLVSTYHANETYQGRRAGEVIRKPLLVREYNSYMGGVDVKDQRLALYPMERKRASKWYLKVFRRLVNTSLMNAYLVYKANVALEQRSPGPSAGPVGPNRPMSHRAFRCAVAQNLAPPRDLGLLREQQSLSVVVHRLDGGTHTFEKTLPSPQHPTRLQRRRCARCSALGRDKRVTTQCSRCKVSLCVGRCFGDYHSLRELKPEAVTPTVMEDEGDM